MAYTLNVFRKKGVGLMYVLLEANARLSGVLGVGLLDVIMECHPKYPLIPVSGGNEVRITSQEPQGVYPREDIKAKVTYCGKSELEKLRTIIGKARPDLTLSVDLH